MANDKLEERAAKHGEKMISVDVSFWTDGIAEDSDSIVPKHAWTGGFVKIRRKNAHGIKTSENPIPFNSLMELPAKIERLLVQEGIVLHTTPKMRKYIKH